jgi:hypothetical protein
MEAGGVITLNDGTTTWTLIALEPGSFFWELGGYVPKPWTDRGVQQMPYKGNQRSGKLGFKGKYAGAQAANDLVLALQRQDAAVSTMLAWSIVVKLPSIAYGSTGEQLTFANCYLAEGGLKFNTQPGDAYDMYDVEMPYLGMAPTPTTY